MEIIERKENPLLKRVELRFRWNHDKTSTPTLADMVNAAAKAEPGSKKELTFVKNVNTRFGQPLTTGLAVIYQDENAATVGPEYVHTRHQKLQSPAKENPPAEEVSEEVNEEGEA